MEVIRWHCSRFAIILWSDSCPWRESSLCSFASPTHDLHLVPPVTGHITKRDTPQNGTVAEYTHHNKNVAVAAILMQISCILNGIASLDLLLQPCFCVICVSCGGARPNGVLELWKCSDSANILCQGLLLRQDTAAFSLKAWAKAWRDRAFPYFYFLPSLRLIIITQPPSHT